MILNGKKSSALGLDGSIVRNFIDREPEITDRALGGIFSPKDATIKGSAFVRALAHSAGNLG